MKSIMLKHLTDNISNQVKQKVVDNINMRNLEK